MRGGLFGCEPEAALRILFVSLPLSVATALVLGLWLLPGSSWAVLLVIACIVVPIDFAPVSSILRDRRVPERVRDLLDVEAGYNDGIVSPLFIFALALADQDTRADTPLQALEAAVPQAAKAILVGLLVGTLLALAANGAQQRAWTTHQSNRLILVAVPLLAFAGGRRGDLRGRRHPRRGGVQPARADCGPHRRGADRHARNPLRAPRTPTCRRLGPRGTTTIVFGLLAFNVLDGGDEHTVGLVVVLCVLGSVILHGVAAPAAAHTYAVRYRASCNAERSGPGK